MNNVNIGNIGEGLLHLIIVGVQWSIVGLEMILRFLSQLKSLNRIFVQDPPNKRDGRPAHHIQSLTTPPSEVVPSLAVSKELLLASAYDTMRHNPDCDDIISQSSSQIERDHKQEQYDHHIHHLLSHASGPILLDNSTKSIALDKPSGKICYMLGSRALTIPSTTEPEYWSWEFVSESRFPECAVLEDVCWLEIKGEINTKLLSPGSTYGAYFVFKIKSRGIVKQFIKKRKCNNPRSGFEYCPVKVSISEVSENGLGRKDHEIKSFYLEDSDLVAVHGSAPGGLPFFRNDGWMEIEMGRFQADFHEALELEMTLKEVEQLHWKDGLVVHGIEVRPLY